jgi:hypothetical protein
MFHVKRLKKCFKKMKVTYWGHPVSRLGTGWYFGHSRHRIEECYISTISLIVEKSSFVQHYMGICRGASKNVKLFIIKCDN